VQNSNISQHLFENCVLPYVRGVMPALCVLRQDKKEAADHHKPEVYHTPSALAETEKAAGHDNSANQADVGKAADGDKSTHTAKKTHLSC